MIPPLSPLNKGGGTACRDGGIYKDKAMKTTLILFLLPALLFAQEFEFVQEFDTIPVEVEGWQIFIPWGGGGTQGTPEFCDIDSDSDLDIFAGDFSGRVKFSQNDGTIASPYFEEVVRDFEGINLSGTYAGRTTPEFCDLDGDGDYDLFSGDGRGLIHYWENIGTTQSPDFVFITDSLDYIEVVGQNTLEFRDIDVDDDYDLFIGDYYGNIWYYKNEGSATSRVLIFVTDEFANIDVGQNASPCFVDIDDDDDYDLFIGEKYGKIWYYLNEGDSLNYNFVYQTNYFGSIDVGDYASPEFADIDGDGDYDLFVGSEDYGPFFYENTGSPQTPEFRQVNEYYLTLDLGSGKSTPQLVDINGDSVLDLFADASTVLDYFENIGTTGNPNFQFVEEGWQGISHSAIQPYFVDIDADADYDLFCGENAVPAIPSISLYINTGTPTNPQMILYDPDYITNDDFLAIVLPVLADIDADNDFDLFITDNDGHFFYYENEGNSLSPNFSLIDTFWQGIQFAYPHSGHKGFTFGDLDEDGDLDMLLQSPWQNNLFFYRNIGTPQVPNMYLESEEFFDYSVDFIYRPYLADIDSDDDLDLFVGDEAGGIFFFRNVTGQNEVGPRRPDVPFPRLDFSIGPNPANPITWISFTLPSPQEATLAVYNILGAKVTTLTSGIQPPGTHSFIWNAADYSSGVYIIQLETPQQRSAERVTVVK
ncbi:hypothetical protein CEE37_13600 [candidate division LCP-89 bacterium B3_LCP]|uniref:Secretion system C-terminal sorting domain-containing protein n=1 Tax=candidate division LCP-89 bacterium B3_LCP TaxID=2012998 RepID=A0A532USS5_UNCL8|nr:MAG: hypothetical protein CEE37_13600 [candidate division LCP-89 bacterium B3_LCP]